MEFHHRLNCRRTSEISHFVSTFTRYTQLCMARKVSTGSAQLVDPIHPSFTRLSLVFTLRLHFGGETKIDRLAEDAYTI